MNSCHPNMKFTHETEENNSIHFVGLSISHNDLGYSTTVYRKPTSTSLCMNFNSFIPMLYKLSVVKCLVQRALQLCSSWEFFHSEISIIKAMMLRNAYPSYVLDRIVKTSLYNYLNPKTKIGPCKERIYIGLPYLGKQIDPVRRKILRICKRFIPQKDIIIFFKPGRTVANFFKRKDVTPLELRSNVVYKYTCASCQASYIGQTTRHMRKRWTEHRGLSDRTYKVVKNKVHSSISDHLLQCRGSNCSLQDFVILANGSSAVELLIKERLLIDRYKPVLNNNIGSFSLLLY